MKPSDGFNKLEDLRLVTKVSRWIKDCPFNTALEKETLIEIAVRSLTQEFKLNEEDSKEISWRLKQRLTL